VISVRPCPLAKSLGPVFSARFRAQFNELARTGHRLSLLRVRLELLTARCLLLAAYCLLQAAIFLHCHNSPPI